MSNSVSISDEKNPYNIETSSIKEIPLDSVLSPSGKVVHIGTGDELDEALAFAQEHGRINISKAEDKKVCRKIDLIIMPLFSMLYMVQFMDKTCISFAAIMGIQTDYHMEGEMYSWTNSAFYLGYVFGSPFAAVVLQKVPTIKFISGCIVIWGLIQCLHCVPKSYATFMLLRTLLGVLEAFVSPIFVIVLNQYYRYSEHFGRMGCFYGFNGLGSIFLGAVSFHLYKYQDDYTISGYKVLFLIIGCMTILLGFVIMIVMPNTPATAIFLNEREKEVIVERIRGNNQGFGNKKFKMEQAIEVCKDPRTSLYFLIALAVAIPNGGISGFGTIILESFGYNTGDALLMKMPVGAFELVALTALPLLSRIIKKRMVLSLIYMYIVLICVCLLAFAPSNKAQLAGYWIFGISPVGIILASSCISSNTAGHTKKLLTNAISLIGYSAGNVIGPQTFRSTDAPHYNNAKAGVVGCYCAAIVLVSILFALNVWENKRRDKIKADLGESYVVPENLEFADLTDFQNPEFRYRV